MFEDYPQQKTTNMRLPSRLTVFTHKPTINLCAREKAKIAPVFKLCASVKWGKKKNRTLLSEKRGGHGAGQPVQQKKEKKKEKNHISSNCLPSNRELWFKMRDRGRVQQSVLQTSQGRENHPSSKKSRRKSKGRSEGLVVGGGWWVAFPVRRGFIKLDVTHTKQWRV